jgi:hypothetical protein
LIENNGEESITREENNGEESMEEWNKAQNNNGDKTIKLTKNRENIMVNSRNLTIETALEKVRNTILIERN